MILFKNKAEHEAMLRKTAASAIAHNDELVAAARMAVAILPNDHSSQAVKARFAEILKRIDA